MLKLLRYVPLLGLLWLTYNAFVLAGEFPAGLSRTLLQVTLPSGATWTVTMGDAFVTMAVCMLYVEIFKATRTSVGSVIDHVMSMVAFVAFLVQFLIHPSGANSTFFVLMLLSLVDVVAGFTVTIIAARRDFGFGNPDVH